MKNVLKTFAQFFLGKTFGQKFFKFLHWLSLKGMNFGGSEPSSSGEINAIEFALKNLQQQEITVFDVGGNMGEYTELWLKLSKAFAKTVKIYTFEPSAKAFSVLSERFNNRPEVTLLPLGLSDKAGGGTLFADHAGSGLASLVKRDLAYSGINMNQSEAVTISTIDEVCAKYGIKHIDFLKMDIEGLEYAALLGAKQQLAAKKIKYLQFEFGGADIDARVFFKDFYNLLSQDFNIFRLLKNGLEPITKYRELDEVFFTCNYLAVLK